MKLTWNKIFIFFVRPLWQVKQRLWFIALALILLSFAQGVFILMAGPFIKALFIDHTAAQMGRVFFSDLFSPSITKMFPETWPHSIGYETLVWFVPGLLFGAGILKAVATFIYNYHQEVVSLYIAKSYRDRLFGKLLSLSYLEIRKKSPANWMSIIMNDVFFLQTRFSEVMRTFLKDSIIILSCLAVLTLIHWPSALVLVIISPFLAALMGRIGKKISIFAETFQKELGKIASAILDIRARFEFIRSQQGEGFELERFRELNQKYYRSIRKSIFIRSAFAPGLEFLGFFMLAFFIYIISHGQWGRDFTPEVMTSFLAALSSILRPLRDIGEQLAKFQETKGALASSFEVLDKDEKEIREKRIVSDKNDKIGSVVINKFGSGFDNEEHFSAEDILIEPGLTTAIVGPSGAGKSTFIKTLAGLIKPARFEGNVPWEILQSFVSMVSQDPFLFNDTLKNNLLYGLKSPLDEKALWYYLELVNMQGEVSSLPEKLETFIHALGSNFSGGQVQRLVIARAISRAKPIWVLDEATSAVDSKSEKDILERLILACREKKITLFAVTHRLQWLSKFDEVWFVEKGKIRLRGTHESLLKNERYRAFCQEGANC